MALIDHSMESTTISSSLDDFFLFHILLPLIIQKLQMMGTYIALRSRKFILESCEKLSLVRDYSPSLIAEAEIFQSEQLLMLLD